MAETRPPSPGALTAEVARLAQKLAEDPRSKVFVPLAEEYIKAGYYEEAAAVLEDGLKIYPTFITALVALGRVFLHLKQIGKAKGVLEEVIRNSPENLLAHRMLAKVYLEAGELGSARRSCAIVLDANPRDEDILAIRASIEEKEGKGAVAIEELPEGDVVLPAARGTQGTAETPPARARAPAFKESRAAESEKVARLRGLLETIRERKHSE